MLELIFIVVSLGIPFRVKNTLEHIGNTQIIDYKGLIFIFLMVLLWFLAAQAIMQRQFFM